MIDVDFLLRMRHSPVRNYVIPGLTSWLIGEQSEKGVVRMFECERDHEENITPHSHRFDFKAVVLTGGVRNVLWNEVDPNLVDPDSADTYQVSRLVYGGQIGSYTIAKTGVGRFRRSQDVYVAGDSYGMKAHQIHSIFFGRGTRVLFFEGPDVSNESVVLEPVVEGYGVVPTMENKHWMFKR